MSDLPTGHAFDTMFAAFAVEHELEDLLIQAAASAEADGVVVPTLSVLKKERKLPNNQLVPVNMDEQDEDDVEQEGSVMTADYLEATDINARVIAHNGTHSLVGFTIPDGLRDEVLMAWDHYEDHECEEGGAMLARLMYQLVEALLKTRNILRGESE